MEAGFWHQKWQRGEIGFHNSEANPLLTAHIGRLALSQGSRIFLPLCGKTLDIGWLLANGYRVAGAELSTLAITELFSELGLEPDITAAGKLVRYSAQNIDIFVGDIFDASADSLGPVSAIYDRAALIALPAEMRRQYASHLITITHAAPQLLITLDYNQQLLDGPPFSVNERDITQLYGATYHLLPVASIDVADGLKGKVACTESVWLLHNTR